MDAEFEAKYEFAGTSFMRQEMSHVLCVLELIYDETKNGRELTKEGRLDSFKNWNVGLNEEPLHSYYYTFCHHRDAEEQKSEAN